MEYEFRELMELIELKKDLFHRTVDAIISRGEARGEARGKAIGEARIIKSFWKMVMIWMMFVLWLIWRRVMYYIY